jgi:hypothetical protein
MDGGTGSWVMPDFALYSAGGQRHAPVPHVGLVLSTCGSAPTIHLQLEQARRMFGPHDDDNTGMAVLVVNDGDEEEAELKALCAEYRADYRTGPKLGHAPGDLRAFLIGLEWAEEKNVQLMVKMSRRFVPLVPWRTELLWLADQNHYACAFGRRHDDRGFLRTDCIALRVERWNVPEIRRQFEEGIELMPESLSVETMVGSTAKVNGGFAVWNLLGDHISRPHDRALQWRACYPYHYGDLSRSLGLPYRDSDFERGVFTCPPVAVEPRAVAADTAEMLHWTRPARWPMVTACDDSMVGMAVVLARSLDRHAPDFFNRRYCLVGSDLSAEGRDRLVLSGYTVMTIPDFDARTDFGSVQARAALYRFFLPELMIDPICLYLDADTMVCGSLEGLNAVADAMLANRDCAAAFEYCRPGYYNTGVLLVNVPAWLEHGIGPKALAEYHGIRASGKPLNNDTPYDESALNMMMGPHGITALPECYNATPGMTDEPTASIVHFRGPKPGVMADRLRFPGLLGRTFDLYENEWKEYDGQACRTGLPGSLGATV